jgi:biopolymer transport protein ExbB
MMTEVILQLLQDSVIASDTVKQAFKTIPQIMKIPPDNLSLWDLALKGGPMMIPIGLLSILAIYIFIDRFIAIIRASKEDEHFMNNIRDFMHTNRIDAALALCENSNSPIAKMIKKGLLRRNQSDVDINAAIENVGTLEVTKLEKNISVLATISGGAPMLGFIGTVIGLVKSFYNMSVAGPNLDIQLLSEGIYQALIATITGLIVGAVAYFCYNILVSRIKKVIFLLQSMASEFMDMLHEPAK